MSASDTLERSKRWLNKIIESYDKGNQKDLEDNVSAFLSSAKSIPDHLLEDYNKKFGFSIPLSEHGLHNAFKKKANNGMPKEFIDWFDEKHEEIRNDKIGNALNEKRNLDIHREIQRPNHMKINIKETIVVSDHVSVMVIPNGTSQEEFMRMRREQREKDRKEIEERAKKSQSQKPPTEVSTDFYFQDIPDVNVKDVCRSYYELMKNLVEEANSKFS